MFFLFNIKSYYSSQTPENYKKMQLGYDQGGYSTYKKTSSYSSSSGYSVDPGLLDGSESVESGSKRGNRMIF
jgi:hypothetical protein